MELGTVKLNRLALGLAVTLSLGCGRSATVPNSVSVSKDGTLSGTLSGTTLTLAMFFAAGGQLDPTPACSIAITGTVEKTTESTLAGTYSGSDPCEGTFAGTLSMTRRP